MTVAELIERLIAMPNKDATVIFHERMDIDDGRDPPASLGYREATDVIAGWSQGGLLTTDWDMGLWTAPGQLEGGWQIDRPVVALLGVGSTPPRPPPSHARSS